MYERKIIHKSVTIMSCWYQNRANRLKHSIKNKSISGRGSEMLLF